MRRGRKKHYDENKVKVEIDKEHLLEIKVDHKSDLEILKLQKIIQEKEETNHHMKVKIEDLEQTVKLERKRLKKEKQQKKKKLVKRDSSLESDETNDDEIVIPEVNRKYVKK